ncbi:N-acetylglucosamine-6-phosphate deacetylase [Aquipuribacter sp. SD81]|uniref:N-acetylglucosamine-6-phosphate deacetylase n=1 Tax=Aquipuribacter sp. SD81 TaxID=3127703 RepID=UPI003019CE9A
MSDTATTAPPATPPTVLRGRVVLPTRVEADGVVVVDGTRIAWVGPAAAAPVPAPAPTDDVLLPGLVDLHCHGGGGVGFPDVTDAATAREAVAEHRRHGTTTLVASLVTAPAAVLLERVGVLAGLAAAGEVAGVHLEGPFLSAVRCGAQDPAHLLPGDPELVRTCAEAARGHLVTMTVAPEVPGVDGPGGVVDALVDVGAVPSFGHTDASAEQTGVALARAGARLAARRPGARPTVTHLFNGMPPMHHRSPGPVAACLAAAARGEVVVELVADGVHLDAATVRTVLDVAAPDAVALVTDAMAAAGTPDGSYVLGGRRVRVRDGVARLAGDDDADDADDTDDTDDAADAADDAPPGALAGGTAHLLDVVRRVVSSGVPLERAVRAAATTPAGVLGRHDVGALEAGRRADVVVTGPDLRVRRVLVAGVVA